MVELMRVPLEHLVWNPEMGGFDIDDTLWVEWLGLPDDGYRTIKWALECIPSAGWVIGYDYGHGCLQPPRRGRGLTAHRQPRESVRLTPPNRARLLAKVGHGG